MNIIKSAYNFVPVEKEDKLFSPSWKEDISLDIPFEDSYSGYLTYQLKAETPIFVKGYDGNFTQINGKYFIPATTIKGCIRSVLEIISYGHLGEKRVQDQIFPYRDLQDRHGYMKTMRNVYCGWLGFDKNNCPIIRNYGKPYHILYTNLLSKCPNIQNLDVVEKYKQYGYIYDYFSELQQKSDHQNSRQNDQRSCQLGGNLKGFVVFSGIKSNKKSDFVLLEKDMNTSDILSINKDTWANFQKLYQAYTQIPTYTYLHFTGRLVFFTIDEINGKKSVKTIGLNYLHKYIAKNKIRTAIPEQLATEQPDLADIMFGSEKYNLKGRIQFSHAFAEHAELLYREGDSIVTVLDSPKASYYPTYVQDGKTWDNQDALISGYKRYPIKPHFNIVNFILKETEKNKYKKRFPSDTEKLKQFIDTKKNYYIPRNENGEINFDTLSKLRPLKDGSIFTGRVIFFNLKKEELGALLSAMTFLDHEKKCKHSIGAGKALGFGAMSISLIEIKKRIESVTTTNSDGLAPIEEDEKKQITQSFKTLMENHKNNWENSERIKELLAMAEGFDQKDLIEFITPMQLKALLNNGKTSNEFSQAKLQLHKKEASFIRFSNIKSENKQKNNTISDSSNHQTKQHNKRQIQSIQTLEDLKGWELELEEEYNGIIKENQIIGINYPNDTYNFSKTIFCSYRIDDYCNKRPKAEDRVQFTILEKEKNFIIINILKISSKKRKK